MKGFIAEARVTGSSSVLREGAEAWSLAADNPILGPLFAAHRHRAASPAPSPISAEKGATVVQVTNQITPHPMLIVDDGPASLKSPGIALLLSILIPGVGQMYNGQVGKGILMLIGCVLLWIVLLGWIIWLWSAIDAYQTAKAMNMRFHRRLTTGMA